MQFERALRLRDKSTWYYAPDVVEDFDSLRVRSPGLLFAGLAEHCPEYIELWKQLNPVLRDRKIIRNLPIRQPLLWTEEPWPFGRPYFVVFWALAQRAFCAAAILARASGDRRRFFRGAAGVLFPGRPTLPASIARTCSSLRISASISARIPFVSIPKVYQPPNSGRSFQSSTSI